MGGERTPGEQQPISQPVKRERTPRSSRTSLCSRPESITSLQHPLGNLVEQLQYKFSVQDETVQQITTRQSGLENKANEMAVSLAGVLEQLQDNQRKTEEMTQLHTEAIREMGEQSRF